MSSQMHIKKTWPAWFGYALAILFTSALLQVEQLPVWLGAHHVLSSSVAIAAETQEDTLPPTYDLREQGMATSAKAQDPWGSCWAFGVSSAIESNLIKQHIADTDIDISEHHLIWFTCTPLAANQACSQPSALSDPKVHSQEGEGEVILKGKKVTPFDLGAYDFSAASALACGIGPQAESAFPYCNSKHVYDNFYRDSTLVESFASSKGDWDIAQDARFLPCDVMLSSFESLSAPAMTKTDDKGEVHYEGYSEEATIKAKRALMQSGALIASYAADVSETGQERNSECFNYETWAQYRDVYKPADHTVAIIGWDDGFKKERFSNALTRQGKASLPPKDGAWIVKNSWGRKDGTQGNRYDWGVDGTGCFYLSYYDKSLQSLQTLNMAKKDQSRAVCMQYDFVGINNFGMGPVAFKEGDQLVFANVFKAPYDVSVDSVTVSARGNSPKADIEVYVLGANPKDPQDGIRLAQKSQAWENPGYRVVKLDHPVEIAKGDSFSVVQKLHIQNDGESAWELPVEMGYTKAFLDQQSAQDDASLIVTKINPGESYYRCTGEPWKDCVTLNDDPSFTSDGLTYGNVLIKTFGAQIVDHPVKTYAQYRGEQLLWGGIYCTSGLGVILCVVVIHRRRLKTKQLQLDISDDKSTSQSSSCED